MTPQARHHFDTDRTVHPQITRDHFAMRPVVTLIVSLGVLAASSSCANPKSQANMAQALSDAANEITGLRSDIAQVQSDIDSLRTVMAKQDTTIQHLAAVANVPITK
jgi:septal ring factor EnvC (AmiA/AmiB activator)